MLNEPTRDKLKAMRLHAMVETWEQQQADPQASQMTFDERLALLVDAEHLARENRSHRRRLAEAKLKLGQACLEDVEYPARRNLDKTVVRQLATCRWVAEHLNVTITGATGTGKTYLACALTRQVCRKGYRATYRRASRLFDELLLARADGTYHKLLSRLARIDVLVIDDLGLAPLNDTQRQDLLEVLEDRYDNRSTIITSQLPTESWHEYLDDPTLADAILDRLLHNSHPIALKGPSRRKQKRKA